VLHAIRGNNFTIISAPKAIFRPHKISYSRAGVQIPTYWYVIQGTLLDNLHLNNEIAYALL
jgi:hypothetical protein